MKTRIYATAAVLAAAAPLALAAPAAAAGDPILDGKRQVVIRPIPSFESILHVDARGRLNLTDGDTDKGLFVLSPVRGKYQIKTAKGPVACMGLKNNGSNPLTVVAAQCDASRPGQLFDIAERPDTTPDGDPTYAISSRSAYLQVSSRWGLIAEELGDAPLLTTYSFVDNGPARR